MGRSAIPSALVIVLCVASCGPPSTWRGWSPDLGASFIVESSGGQTCVRTPDHTERCHDGVALQQIVFSPDSRQMAYPARVGEAWTVVLDGIPGPRFDGIGDVVFSPSGGRLAYAAERGGHWTVVVDGLPGEGFDSLYAGSLVFDPTGRRHAFAASRGGAAVVVVDGVAGRAHDGVGQLRFSEDGARFGYVARNGMSARLVLEGEPGSVHDAVSEFRFRPPSAEGPVAYVAREGTDWWVIDGDDRAGPYREARDLRYRPRDGALAFVASDDEGMRVILAGEMGRLHTRVDVPVFSRAGTRWGYIAHDSIESSVVLDGSVVDAGEWASDLTFSPDGSRFAYVLGGLGGDAVVHDGGAAAFDLVVEGTLHFLEDVGLWACLAGDAEDRSFFVAVEGHEDRPGLDWLELTGVTSSRGGGRPDQGAALEGLRAWVRASAARVVERASRP